MNYSIGTTYEGKDFSYLKEILHVADHIEVSPDSIARKRNGKVTLDNEAVKQLRWMQDNSDAALLIHGVGLSIGSHDGYSLEYVQLLDELFEQFAISWHSEHLAYSKVNGESIGTMLTLPRTDEVMDMVCHRIDEIQKRYKVPFLLENVISMLPPAHSKYSEAAFLNRVVRNTGCGLVMDVYNLECDSKNFGFGVREFVEEVNLNSVVEMHLAGGPVDPEFDFQMDIHTGSVAASTLNLTQDILKKKPKNLKAITFEILEEFIPQAGVQKIIDQIKKLDTLFNSHEPRSASN